MVVIGVEGVSKVESRAGEPQLHSFVLLLCLSWILISHKAILYHQSNSPRKSRVLTIFLMKMGFSARTALHLSSDHTKKGPSNGQVCECSAVVFDRHQTSMSRERQCLRPHRSSFRIREKLRELSCIFICRIGAQFR